MTEPLKKYKEFVERDFKSQGQPIPAGFVITYNEENQLVKIFLNAESYKRLKEQQDEIVSSWNGKAWEDKLTT